MAYTTENGKLVKTSPIHTINEKEMTQCLAKMAYILIEECPAIGYDSNADMRGAAHACVLAYKLDRGHLKGLLAYRDKLEAAIDKKYNIDRSTSLSAMAQDLGAHYQAQGVTQDEQVMSGLMDSIIGAVWLATQKAA